MKLFKKKSSVGLQLETGVIRAVEVTGTLSDAVLVKAEQVKIPEQAIVEGVVKDTEAVAGGLKELWERSRISSREVVLGVSNQGVLMRLADFPKIELNKLDKMLRFQAGEYFPIPVSEMVLDFAVVGEMQGETGPRLETLMVAVRQDMLDKSLQATAGAALVPRVVDASPLALMRTVPESMLAGTIIFADIASGITSLMLSTAGIPRFVRIIPTNLQAASSQDFLIGDIVFEAKQQIASTVEHESISGDDWSGWGRSLAEEIRSSIGFYLAQRDSLTVDCLCLSGQGARSEGLSELINSLLDIPVKVINPAAPFQNAVDAHNVNWSKEGTDFAVAVGLALRGLET